MESGKSSLWNLAHLTVNINSDIGICEYCEHKNNPNAAFAQIEHGPLVYLQSAQRLRISQKTNQTKELNKFSGRQRNFYTINAKFPSFYCDGGVVA